MVGLTGQDQGGMLKQLRVAEIFVKLFVFACCISQPDSNHRRLSVPPERMEPMFLN